MAKPLIDDALWAIIEPLISPKPRRFRFPGRNRLDNRRALTGIVFVLKTGIGWEDLPQEMDCGSGMTCWRRLHEWQAAGVWQAIHEALLARLNAAGQIDWSRTVVDSSSIRALKGGHRPAPTRPTKAKRAASIT
jgi:transposase